jgi:hypothetical protein
MGKWCLPPSPSQRRPLNPAGFGLEERTMRQFNIHQAKAQFSKLLNDFTTSFRRTPESSKFKLLDPGVRRGDDRHRQGGRTGCPTGSLGQRVRTKKERPARRAHQNQPRIRSALARRSGSLVRRTGSNVSKMVFDLIALRFPIAPRSMMQNNHRIKSSRPRSAQ